MNTIKFVDKICGGRYHIYADKLSNLVIYDPIGGGMAFYDMLVINNTMYKMDNDRIYEYNVEKHQICAIKELQ